MVRRSDDDRLPDTESHGDLDPPRRRPPTAVGAATPGGEEPQRRPAELNDPVRRAARVRLRPALPVRVIDAMVRRVRRLVRAVARA